MQEEYGSKISNGFIWSFAERITAQLVSTIVTIILARLLTPYDYGIVSIVTIFITICNVFVTSGFGSAVVQRKNADEKDFNTAFTVSFITSLMLYVGIFFLAPCIAQLYEIPDLIAVTRVMGIRIILASINTIQHAFIQRKMQFKKFFIVTLVGTAISAFLGIFLAIRGFGVWALVAQYLTNGTIDTLMLLFVSSWKPQFFFSREKAKSIFSFGWKVLITNLIFTLESDVKSLIIGKEFSASQLAFYDQGKKYPSLVVNNVNSAINKVMLPAFSKQQDSISRMKELLRKMIRIGTYLLAPIMIGFAFVARNFTLVILTEKWLPCVPFMQIFAISFLTRPLEAGCHQALLGYGRSDIVLYIMSAIHITSFVVTLYGTFVLKSVFLVALSTIFSCFVSVICFSNTVKRLFEYKFSEQLSDIFITLLICFVMGIIVKMVELINIIPIVQLFIQVMIGIIFYFVVSELLRIPAYNFLKNYLFKLIKKKKEERI